MPERRGKTRRGGKSGRAEKKRALAATQASNHGLSTADLRQLTQEIEGGFKQQSLAMKHADKMLGMYMGSHASGNNADLHHIPIFHRAMLALLANLAGRAGEWSVTPKHTAAFDPIAWTMQAHMQTVSGQIKHQQKSQMAVLNALVGWGLTYTFVRPTDKLQQLETGEFVDPAEIGFQSINMNDTFVGRNAVDPHHIPMQGHRYRAIASEIVDSRVLTEDEVALLPKWVDLKPDRRNFEHTEGQSGRQNADLSEKYVVLTRVFLNDRRYSREPLVIVLAGAKDGAFLVQKGSSGLAHVVSIREWDKDLPDNGGYNRLSFIDLPGSALGTSPAAFMVPIAEALNNVTHQWIESMGQHKKVLLAKKGQVAKELVQALSRAKDGTVVEVASVSGITPAEIGGPSDTTESGIGTLLNMSGRAGMNVEFLQTKGEMTATEVQALQEQLGVALGFMANRSSEWQDTHAKMFGWHEWRNPLLEHKVEMELTAPSGRSIKVPFTLTKEMLQDRDFFDHNFSIRHGSMSHRSDSQIASAVRQLVAEDIPMGLQIEQMSGGVIKVADIIDLSRRSNQIPMAEIERLLHDSRVSDRNIRIALMQYGGSDGLKFPSGGGGFSGGLPGGLDPAAQTGNQSANFDPSQIAQQTAAAV